MKRIELLLSFSALFLVCLLWQPVRRALSSVCRPSTSLSCRSTSAQEKGFFKDEGLDVQFVIFNAGSTNLQSLMGGDIQMMGSAFVETLGGRAAGYRRQKLLGHL